MSDASNAKQGYSTIFVGGIIGAVATILVTAVAGSVPVIFNWWTGLVVDALVRNVTVTTYQGNFIAATKVWEARCAKPNETLLTGICNTGNNTDTNVHLVNQGIQDDNGHRYFMCKWEGNPTLVNGLSTVAICLTRKSVRGQERADKVTALRMLLPSDFHAWQERQTHTTNLAVAKGCGIARVIR